MGFGRVASDFFVVAEFSEPGVSPADISLGELVGWSVEVNVRSREDVSQVFDLAGSAHGIDNHDAGLQSVGGNPLCDPPGDPISAGCRIEAIAVKLERPSLIR